MTFWVAGAVVGGTLISSKLQSDAAGRAARRAQDSTDAANQMQQDQYYQNREDNMPLMDLRNSLIPRIRTLAQQDVGLTPDAVMSEPGYQFGLNEGLRNIQNTAAARGGLYSGATLKALNRYGTDYATSKYGDAWNRQQTGLTNALNRASSAAGFGQAGVTQTQQAGSNYANNVGNNLLSNANFQGAAGMSQANSWGNLFNLGSSYLYGGFGGTQPAAPIYDRSIRRG